MPARVSIEREQKVSGAEGTDDRSRMNNPRGRTGKVTGLAICSYFFMKTSVSKIALLLRSAVNLPCCCLCLRFPVVISQYQCGRTCRLRSEPRIWWPAVPTRACYWLLLLRLLRWSPCTTAAVAVVLASTSSAKLSYLRYYFRPRQIPYKQQQRPPQDGQHVTIPEPRHDREHQNRDDIIRDHRGHSVRRRFHFGCSLMATAIRAVVADEPEDKDKGQ